MTAAKLATGAVPMTYQRSYFNGSIDDVATVRASITAAAGKRLINIEGWARTSTGGSGGTSNATATLRLTYDDDSTESASHSYSGFGNGVRFGAWGIIEGATTNFDFRADGFLANPFPSLGSKTIKKAEVLIQSSSTNAEGIALVTAVEVPA